MSKVINKPPAGEPWVWFTRDLLASDAWRSQGINTRRFVDFLLLENIRKGGRENGDLKAPRRQLEDFGIGARFVSEAISGAEIVGLVDCNRGGMRVATTYALTWFPHRDGTPASNRWRTFQNPELAAPPGHNLTDKGKSDSREPDQFNGSKSRNLPYKGKSTLVYKGKSDCPNLTDKGKSDSPKSLVYKGKHPSREDSTTVFLKETGPANGADGSGA